MKLMSKFNTKIASYSTLALVSIMALPTQANAQATTFFGKEGFTEIANNGVAMLLFILQIVVLVAAGIIVFNLATDENGIRWKKIFSVCMAAAVLIALPEIYTYIQDKSSAITIK